MAQVTRTATVPASADAVWQVIGGFQSLHEWHPAIHGSTREEDGGAEIRRLVLGGGAEVVERSWGAGDGHSYGYEILDPGPLPIANYRATISAVPAGDGCCVIWTSTFEPRGDGAEGAIAGVYEAGLQALAEKFAS